MPGNPFDPLSTDAMFSQILERLSQQDREYRQHRQEIREIVSNFQTGLSSTDNRITKLEHSAWRNRGATAAIAFFIPLAWQWFVGRRS